MKYIFYILECVLSCLDVSNYGKRVFISTGEDATWKEYCIGVGILLAITVTIILVNKFKNRDRTKEKFKNFNTVKMSNNELRNKIEATLQYGRVPSASVVWIIASGISLSIVSITVFTVVSFYIEDMSTVASIVCPILLIGILVLLCILLSVLKRLKTLKQWTYDAQSTKAEAVYEYDRLEVVFELNDKTYRRYSHVGKLGNRVLSNKYLSKYSGKSIDILYSVIYDEVMIVNGKRR